MATALPAIADLTGSSVTESGFKTQLAALFAALRERGDPLGVFGQIQNLGLAFSVGSNALTCAVKQRDGSTNADATNVISIPFRHATATNGSFNVRNISAALSLTISSGSTLGHVSAVASPIYWYLIDNAGTVELAASTKYFGEFGIVSTTAEGGAGAADSNIVMYSATARSNVPYICIARTTDTQTTAGTWTAVPSTVELSPFNMFPFVHGSDVASASTIDLNAVNGRIFDITGTTGISAMTLEDGGFCVARFTGVLTLTHSSSLFLNNAASNITTAAGDYAIILGYAAGVVRVIYFRATGRPVNLNLDAAALTNSTINSTVIGGTTPAAGTFSALTSTGLVDISGASGGQIKFPAAQNASANANTLDDYEEGTFTVTDNSGAGLSFTVFTGNYTKIGRLVHARFSLQYPVTANGSAAKITSFPFAAVGGDYGGHSSYTTLGSALTGLMGTTSLDLYDLSGVAKTNANLSGKTVAFNFPYTAAT